MYDILSKIRPLFAPEGEGDGGAGAGGADAGAGADGSGDGGADDGGAGAAEAGDGDGGEPEGVTALGGDGYKAEAEDKGEGEADDKDKSEAEADPEKKAKEGDDKGKEKKGDEGKVDPSSYVLEVPEGYTLNKEIEADFRQFAAERNLSQEDVNALRDMQLKLSKDGMTEHANVVKTWGKELRSDEELGGRDHEKKMATARYGMREFFDDEVISMMDRTGLGNHPAFVRGFYRLGQAMGETPTLRGSKVAADRDAVEILYPNG